MIRHHPADDLLLGLAAGRIGGGPALLVSVHLEYCAHCRSRLRTLQALGGVILDSVDPEPLSDEALSRTLVEIERAHAPPPPRHAPEWPAPALPGGTSWPASLRGCRISSWRWMGPGMRFARVVLPHDAGASLYLLGVGPGRSLPSHSHNDNELTQVLCGEFEDGRSTFAAGDFDEADAEVHHQPVVSQTGVCVCLAYVAGRLRFDGRIARFFGGWIGM